MPVEIYEDTLELECESLQPAPIEPDGKRPACWPMPELRGSGQRRVMTLRTVVLANDWLQVTVCPDLGGRIVALRDRRTQADLISLPRELDLIPGGPRGIWAPHGIQWIAGEEIRRGGLGQVEDMIHEPDEEGEPGAILLFELIPGTRLSWHAAMTLHADRAELTLEMSLYNRSTVAQPAECGLRFGPDSGLMGDLETPLITTGAGQGLVWLPESDFARLETGPHGVTAHARPEGLRALMPRGTEKWRVRLAPFSAMDEVLGASRDAVIGRREGQVVLQAARRAEGAVLDVQAADGIGRLNLNLNPEHRVAIDLPPDITQGTLSHDDEPLLSFRLEPLSGQDEVEWAGPARSAVLEAALQPEEGTVEAEIRQAMEDFEAGRDFRLSPASIPSPLAAATLTAQAARTGSASLAREAALLNPEDPLAWWLSASLTHLAKGEEGDDLMQAHALAPLEPMLRAESFLRQDETLLSEPSPLLRPLARAPDLLLECVHLLSLCGRAKDAARLLDEAIRHLDCRMYRLAFAALHERHTGLRVEAAQHVMAAKALPDAPPAPWRTTEVGAIQLLRERYPGEAWMPGA